MVEILAIVLFVGSIAGWRNVLVGAASAAGIVVVVALAVGGSLTLVPVHLPKTIAGATFLVFGQMWVRTDRSWAQEPPPPLLGCL